MTLIGAYYYPGFSLEEKFAWVNQKPGSRATEPVRASLMDIGQAYIASDETIRRALNSLGADWEGLAGDSADAALRRTAELNRLNGEEGQRGGLSVQSYGVAFEEMRTKVVYADPGEYGSWSAFRDRQLELPWGGHLLGIQSDYLDAVEANRTADSAANAALKGYEDQAREMTETFPDPTVGPSRGGVGTGGVGGGPSTGQIPMESSGVPIAPVSMPSQVGTALGTVPDSHVPALSALPGGADAVSSRADTRGAAVPIPTAPRPPIPPSAATAPPPLPRSPTPPPLPRAAASSFPGLAEPLRGVITGRPGGLPTSTGRSFRADLLRSGEPAGPVGRAPVPGGGTSEPASRAAAPSRPAGPTGAGGSALYPPMTGAAGRSADHTHRPRYLIPSSEPFDVDVPCVAPVIGAER